MKIPGNPDAISPSNLTSDNCPAIMKEENANYNLKLRTMLKISHYWCHEK